MLWCSLLLIVYFLLISSSSVLVTTMTSLRVLGVLVALGLISVIVGSEERRKRDVCTDHSNGCSIPGNLPFFYKATFTPSCDRHDVCYRCVSTWVLATPLYTCIPDWHLERSHTGLPPAPSASNSHYLPYLVYLSSFFLSNFFFNFPYFILIYQGLILLRNCHCWNVCNVNF